MKKTTRTLSIVLLAASLGLGSKMGDAATYDDAANITTLQTQSFLTRRIQEMKLLPKNQPILIRDFYGSTMYQTLILVRFKMSHVRLNKKHGSIMCG